MRIKRYIGNNTQEAILKVKADLGADSLILNTKKVRRKGFINLFKKPMIEVLAAVDNYQVTPDQEKTLSLSDRVNDIELMLHKINKKLDDTSSIQVQDTISKNPEQDISSKMLKLFYNNLISSEVQIKIAEKIIEDTRTIIGEKSSVNEVVSAIKSVISNALGRPAIIEKNHEKKPRIIILVGPTGVGKTTTLAKIAADMTLVNGKKVGLITADTYRIAAVEQLKTYAQILDIPISVTYSATEIKEAIKAYSEKDLILIDTAGRGYKDKSQLEEVKSLINNSQADEVFLVLSMTMNMASCNEILKNYSFLEEYKIIFTKADETPVSGIILNTRVMTGKSLSYITTGQNVPEDIEMIDTDMITKNLLGSIN